MIIGINIFFLADIVTKAMYFVVKYQVVKMYLLYLPTQIRFLIGGERVTCHWSKLTNVVGKQQLELSTCT